MRLATFVHVEDKTTENVIADSTAGRTDRTVVIGAHLDSVLEGPGTNDNRSGTAAILRDRPADVRARDQPTQRGPGHLLGRRGVVPDRVSVLR